MSQDIVVQFWTVNLGRGVSREEYIANVRRLLKHTNRTIAIIFFQEIDEADAPNEHFNLRQLTREDFAKAAWDTAVPILVSRKRARIVKRRVTFASKGLAKVTPHRVIAEAVVKMTNLADGKVFADWPRWGLLGTHLPLDRPSTQTRRARVRLTLAARVAFHVALRHFVVYALDSNTHGVFPRMGRGEITIAEHGIDKIRMILPKGYTLISRKPLHADLTIDGHDASGAEVVVRKVA